MLLYINVLYLIYQVLERLIPIGQSRLNLKTLIYDNAKL